MQNQLFDKVLFHPHKNLGDCFVYAGIVRYYAEHSNQVYIPTFPKAVKTVTTLHQDIPNIKIIDYEETKQIDDPSYHKLLPLPVLPIVGTYNNKNVLWDEQYYTLHDLPFSLRYRNFVLPKNLPGSKILYDKIVKEKDYIVIHNRVAQENHLVPIDISHWRTPEDKLRLQDIKQVVVIDETLSDNMMDYIDLIRNATEIHCVPSSFFCLVDSITSQTQAKLYYHNIREQTFIRVNNKYNDHRWTIINYPPENLFVEFRIEPNDPQL